MNSSLSRTLAGVASTLLLSIAVLSHAHAFPVLNLTPGTPNIVSDFITVDYAGDNDNGNLTASGFAFVLTPTGSPAVDIVGGNFDIYASLNFNALTATGTLAISGTIAAQGFNSGTLLTGTLQTFGAGAGDPLEFLFDVTGGDAAGLFGGIGAMTGIVVSGSGYSGSFASAFSSAPFSAISDTFAQQTSTVPEPGTLWLTLLGGALFFRRRRTAA